MSNLTFLYEGPGVLEFFERQKFNKKLTETKFFFFKKYFIFRYDVIIIFLEEIFFSVDFL